MDPTDSLGSLNSQNPFSANFVNTNFDNFPNSQHVWGNLNDLFSQGPNVFNYNKFSASGNDLTSSGNVGQEDEQGGNIVADDLGWPICHQAYQTKLPPFEESRHHSITHTCSKCSTQCVHLPAWDAPANLGRCFTQNALANGYYYAGQSVRNGHWPI
jgi:hypothetical protein